jgi:hypothetical protein
MELYIHAAGRPQFVQMDQPYPQVPRIDLASVGHKLSSRNLQACISLTLSIRAKTVVICHS